ncbi:kinase-like domain-containing protein [Catenaria anguillulae PL171]|uniref:ethanolamine kinase n=1 Tax=Catenaria anguillulae PL171 TaxID=765915 RepID=A0A1Y2H675_9FUNG|nr:kinase-like domain-containing protein [Catenaria anguillulae PL171]
MTAPTISVRRIDYTVDSNNPQALDSSARHLGVVLGLCSEADAQAAKVTRCKQGITNKLLKVSLPSGNKYLMRVYGHGTSTLIDRDAEVRNMAYLASHGLAPPLHARFNNGLVYGFVKGTAAHPDALAHPQVWPAIAKHLAEWHSLPLPSPSSPSNDGAQAPPPASQLFVTLDRWLGMVTQAAQARDGPTATQFEGIALADLGAERDRLFATLPASPLTFNHNDLLSGNVILQHDQAHADLDAIDLSGDANEVDPSDTPDALASVVSAKFIDYEYGALGPAAFDVANHWCEWAGFECEYWRYPATETQRAWLTTYLTALNKEAKPPTVAEVDTWVEHVKEYTPASHFFWILWALVQATVSDIDFDYAGYARLRWSELKRWCEARCRRPSRISSSRIRP